MDEVAPAKRVREPKIVVENPDSLGTLTSSSTLQASLLGGCPRSNVEASEPLGWRLQWRDAPRGEGASTAADFAKYERVRVLGRGAHGVAVLIRHKKSGETVVCKELSLATLDAQRLEEIQNEDRSHHKLP